MTVTHPAPPGDLRGVLADFALDGELVDFEPFHRGHIHDTFVSTWREAGGPCRYLHQRLNDEVFRDVPGLMHNIEAVTGHLEAKLADDDDFHTLRLVPTRTGCGYLSDERGSWRTYHFIEDTESFDLCDSPARARSTARAFGRFQSLLLDLDVSRLRETIPFFFSTPYRLRQFDDALAAASHERRAAAADEIAFVQERRGMADVIEEHLSSGAIPVRVVHGDTKLNNVLFDHGSGRPVCVVDLDTCMPSYSLYDFGDLVRFTAATSEEDERDLSLAGMDLELYRALVAGYLETAGGFLTELERELMPFSARLVTLTIGTRFLTDFLAGDVYFKIARPGHNLDRARVQMRMVADMEAKEAEMRVE